MTAGIRKLAEVRVSLVLSFGLLWMTAGASAQQANPPAFAYLLHCSGCHIEDGRGDPPEVPDLREDLDTLLQTAEGRAYLLQVPGITDSPITAEEMAGLMNWMVTKFYPDLEGFKPFTADEILAGRSNRLANPLQYRRRLIEPTR